MTTYELEEEVYSALIGNEELITALPLGEKAIYHHAAPTVEPKRYPIIVYSPIADEPVLAGDNHEFAHRVIFRIHVIAALKRFDADKRNFNAACNLIPPIMEERGFVRRMATPSTADGKLIHAFEFARVVTS